MSYTGSTVTDEEARRIAENAELAYNTKLRNSQEPHVVPPSVIAAIRQAYVMGRNTGLLEALENKLNRADRAYHAPQAIIQLPEQDSAIEQIAFALNTLTEHMANLHRDLTSGCITVRVDQARNG